MSGSQSNSWLRRFSWLTALCTLGLIAVGGLVTSHEAGMAVPDWPNTYGYNMFLFPFSKWVGGILFEHSHRLVASLVGLLTTILAMWLWIRETSDKYPNEAESCFPKWLKKFQSNYLGKSFIKIVGGAFKFILNGRLIAGLVGFMVVILLMGFRKLPVYITLASLAPLAIGFAFYQISRQGDSGLRWWGVAAFAAVILQGVLGGLRVVLFKDEIGIFHAALAQLFFVLVCLIALFATQWWKELPATAAATPVSRILLGATLLIFVQLILGATMRHQHAGLAI